MSVLRSPPALLLLAFASAAVCLVLAAHAVVTFPTALLSAVSLAFYLVPPARGVTRQHYWGLLALLLICLGTTYFWQAAWSDGLGGS